MEYFRLIQILAVLEPLSPYITILLPLISRFPLIQTRYNLESKNHLDPQYDKQIEKRLP